MPGSPLPNATAKCLQRRGAGVRLGAAAQRGAARRGGSVQRRSSCLISIVHALADGEEVFRSLHVTPAARLAQVSHLRRLLRRSLRRRALPGGAAEALRDLEQQLLVVPKLG